MKCHFSIAFFFLEHIGALGVIILRNIRKFDYTKHLRRKKKYRFWKIDQRQTTDNRTTRTAGGPILAPPSCTRVQPRPWHSRAEAAAPSNTRVVVFPDGPCDQYICVWHRDWPTQWKIRTSCYFLIMHASPTPPYMSFQHVLVWCFFPFFCEKLDEQGILNDIQ